MVRDLIFIALAMFIWGVGESGFLYFQPLYLQRLGASPLSIGAILGASGIAMAIAHIPAGYLADKIGRRPLLWASWIMGMLAAWVMALGTNLPVFVTGLLLYGVTSFVMAPLNSYLTAARGRWSVARVITIISASYNTGAIIGPLLGGVIGDRVGLRQIYLVAAILFVISTLVILMIRPQPVEAQVSGEKKNGLNITPRYIGYLAIVFLAMLATTLPQPLSSNFLQNQRGLSLRQIGQLGSIASLGMVMMNLVLGQIDARRGFLLSQVSVGAFSLLIWRGTGMAWFAPAYFLLGGYRTARAFATAQTRNLVHSANMGLAYGITETVNSSAVILASPFAGYLYQLNPGWMYLAGLALVIVSLCVGLVFNPAGRSAHHQETYSEGVHPGSIRGEELASTDDSTSN